MRECVFAIYISSLLRSVQCKNLSEFGMCLNRLTFAEWQTLGLTSYSCSSISHHVVTSSVLRLVTWSYYPLDIAVPHLVLSHFEPIIIRFVWFGGFSDRDVIYRHADSSDLGTAVIIRKFLRPDIGFISRDVFKNSSNFQRNVMDSNLKTSLTHSL